jgi:hypothetical protein
MRRRASFDFPPRGRGGASQKVDGPNVPEMDPPALRALVVVPVAEVAVVAVV